MKKKLLLFFTLFVLIFIFAGCGNKISEKQLKSELETNSKYSFLSNDETITDIIIEKSELNDDKTTEIISTMVTTENSEIEYKKGVVFTYSKDSDKNWQIDKIDISKKSEWSIKPLKGITEKSIKETLEGETISVDGEEWLIEKSNIKDLKIKKQSTDIKNKKDKVVLSLSLDDLVETASGELTIDYIFNDKWEINNLASDKSFTAEVKPEFEINMSSDKLLNELDGQTFVFGETPEREIISQIVSIDASNKQSIKIEKDNITDFKIEKSSSISKGTIQEFDCSMKIKKQYATFSLNAKMLYSYSDKWTLQSIEFDSSLEEVNLTGEWKGTYTAAGDRGEAVLKITECTADGNISGIYSWVPITIDKYREPGSYYVKGTVDKDEFILLLQAGDWINKPEKALSVTKVGINTVFYVDEEKIIGIGHENSSIKLYNK